MCEKDGDGVLVGVDESGRLVADGSTSNGAADAGRGGRREGMGGGRRRECGEERGGGRGRKRVLGGLHCFGTGGRACDIVQMGVKGVKHVPVGKGGGLHSDRRCVYKGLLGLHEDGMW